MNILQLTPGAGGMYCGNCFRDNALVARLRALGHSTLMVPLYVPLKLEEADASAGTPIFFSGVNVYLQQKAALFRRLPSWLHRLLASPALLRLTASFAARTRPEDVGDILLSMLRGEHGHQAREIDTLVAWLKTQPRPEVICLSNALLLGMGRQLKAQLGGRLACMLQGEDSFLDALPSSQRQTAWQLLAERAQDADLLIAPSRYFGDRMSARLGLAPQRVRVVANGINVAGFPSRPRTQLPSAPVLGYFARMCREKGLDTLVEAFIQLRQRGRVPGLRLRIGGGCGPGDEPFVNGLRERLKAHGVIGDTEFHRNVDRAAKIALLESLTAFSVPALYGEAFGLYVIEALAAGVPVVLPRQAAFPELVETSGGGVLCEPGPVGALADALEGLLLDSGRLLALGAAGHTAVRQHFTTERMAENVLRAFQSVC